MSTEDKKIETNKPEVKTPTVPLTEQWATSVVLNHLTVTVEVPDGNGGHPETFHDVQFSWHNGMTGPQFAEEWKAVKGRLAWLAQSGVNTSNGTAIPTAATTSDVLPAANTGDISHCVMLKVEAQFKDKSKPKLSFECDGLGDPITCAFGIDKLAELLQPVGISKAAIVIGKKYAVDFWVKWEQNGKYKNVVSLSKTKL